MGTPQKIFAYPEAFRFPSTGRILDALKGAQVPDSDDFSSLAPREQKRCLRLAVRKGEHVKIFDGGCGCGEEWYVAPVAGCPMDCEYCYLQDYLDSAVPTFFVNIEEMLAELREKLSARGGAPVRVHAGQMSDALALDNLTGVSKPLIDIFREFPRATLELRTKTGDMNSLLAACGDSPPENVVVSWTMSPQEMVRRCEHGTAPLAGRIRAAALCRKAGLKVGMRLDPIVLFPGWEAAYSGMIEDICGSPDAARIESWVLGCFRYRAELGEIIRRRFPESDILNGEFVRGSDGKRRYFRLLRLEAYLRIGGAIRRAQPAARIDLCMETEEVARDFASAF